MNTFYGASDPTELPFDLRHARAPIRFALDPNAGERTKSKARVGLCKDLMAAAELILDNLPDLHQPIPAIAFHEALFKGGDQIALEGDFAGQINPTFFADCTGFIYLRGEPLRK